MHAERRQGAADGGQASLPWRLSQSVIDSVRPAGAEFARNADSARSLIIRFSQARVRRLQRYVRGMRRRFAPPRLSS